MIDCGIVYAEEIESMRILITILDSITETSMPFNEFALYRATHYPEEKQILIICGLKGELPKVEIPENLEIIYAGRKLIGIRNTVQKVIKDCKKAGIPYVVHMHQVQSGFLAEFAMLGTGFRKKVLFTVHSTFTGYELHNKFLSFINTLFAQRVTCVSNIAYQKYPKFIKRIKGNRIQALQNGVDTERIDSVLSGIEERKDNNYISFIYVARFVPIKNHKFLVDVLKRCDSNVRFVFVGSEDEQKAVRYKAENEGIADQIIFTGLISRNEVFNQLKNADYYISSSTLEGLPVSVLEAMYCGLPCILSDIPQHREVAYDKAVILSYDVNEWSKEINRMAKMNTEEREKLSQSIKDYVVENFTLSRMHEKYDMIYDLLR